VTIASGRADSDMRRASSQAQRNGPGRPKFRGAGAVDREIWPHRVAGAGRSVRPNPCAEAGRSRPERRADRVPALGLRTHGTPTLTCPLGVLPPAPGNADTCTGAVLPEHGMMAGLPVRAHAGATGCCLVARRQLASTAVSFWSGCSSDPSHDVAGPREQAARSPTNRSRTGCSAIVPHPKTACGGVVAVVCVV
jgi:hypothetical protein